MGRRLSSTSSPSLPTRAISHLGGRTRRAENPLLVGVLLVAILLSCLPIAASAQEPGDGDPVTLRGTVVDDEGKPVEGVTVLLEASRKRFSLRHFENRQGDALQLPQKTNAAGEFRFAWTWDRHYNIFELAFGLEVTREGAPSFEIVERRDVTSEMSQGTPPPLHLKLKNAGWLRWLRLFMDGQASADEKKLYRDLGRPQKLTADGTISSWWYFELGKVYRLDGGKLDQVIPFDPIKETEATEEPE